MMLSIFIKLLSIFVISQGLQAHEHTLSYSYKFYGHEPSRFNASTLDSIQQVYTQIAALPIPELLDLIEEIVNQVDHFSQQYELHNQSLSWYAWLEHYWWIPPTVLIAFLMMMMRYKKIAQHLPQG